MVSDNSAKFTFFTTTTITTTKEYIKYLSRNNSSRALVFAGYGFVEENWLSFPDKIFSYDGKRNVFWFLPGTGGFFLR